MEWWGWVVSVLGAIILLANGIKAIRELLTPATAIAEKVEKLDKRDKEYAAKFEEINAALGKQEQTNQAVLKALVAIVNHEIDGNGIEGLKKARDELSNSIIERN